jgi:hypothetical protein
MRLRLRAIVETVHALHDVSQLGGNLDGSDPAAIRATAMLVAIKLHLKRFCEVGGLSGEKYAASSFVDLRDS